MTTYNWSALTNGQSIAFDPAQDTLHIDDPSISALLVAFTFSQISHTSTFTFSGKSITLQTDLKTITTSNFTFADGSLWLVGDDTTGTLNDDGPNTLVGGNGDDRLIGLGGDDSLTGGAGNDVFSMAYATFAVGNDTIDGGAGSDRLNYGGGSLNAVTVNLASHIAISAQGSTTLISIEAADGARGNDVFIGGDPAHGVDSVGNTLSERFSGKQGNDTITGGSGTDFFTIADYSNNTNTQGVNANLFNGVVSDGGGGTDTLVNVDALRGGSGNDLLVGGSLSRSPTGFFFELFRGNAGNDTLDGGNANSGGQDSSSDRADYSNNTNVQAVNVNLSTGIALDGRGGTDTLIDIDHVYGGAGNDTLTGSTQNDDLDGGAGNDTLDGGAGFDTARFQQSTAGVIVNMSAASITVNTITVTGSTANDGMGGTDTLIGMENVRGSDFNDYIRGSDDVNIRQFLAGDAGDDTIDGGDGIDFANYSNGALVLGGLNAFIENGSGTVNDKKGGTDTLINIEGLAGTHGNDTLTGGLGDQWFQGFGGSDSINGGAGNDWVTYVRDPTGVTINLAAGTATDGWNGLGGLLALGGIDTLISIENAEGSNYDDTLTGGSGDEIFEGRDGDDSINGAGGSDAASYTRSPAGVNVNLALGTASDGWGGNDALTSIERAIGSPYGDTLTGTDGNDTLTGAAGNDTLDGGSGVDTANYAAVAGAVTVNLANGTATGADGSDTLSSIENVSGSNSDDLLTGDANDNLLEGLGGNDTLIGNGGNDTLDGGTGVDSMVGGTGDDVHIVDSVLDVVVEAPGEGTDTVISSVSITLPDNVEIIQFVGGAGGVIIGNELDNVIAGSAFDDTLIGGGGNDTLDGGAGVDTADYSAATGSVTVSLAAGTASGAAGSDTLVNIENIRGSDFTDTLTGDSNQNLLEGLGGRDTLDGGAGSDTLDGGAAADSLKGGNGNDTYYVDDVNDVVTEVPNEISLVSNAEPERGRNQAVLDGFIDTVIAAIDYSLENIAFVENITLNAASTAIVATGNALDNVITGNTLNNTLNGLAGNDTLAGGEGADSLAGGNGNDTYYVDDAGDVVTEVANQVSLASGLGPDAGVDQAVLDGFIDTVIAAIDYSLQSVAYVENLTLNGAGSATEATGNELDNVLTGNTLNNTLSGLAGNDTIDGSTGLDIAVFSGSRASYTVGAAGSSITGPDGSDTVSNIERLQFSDNKGVAFDLGTGEAAGNTVRVIGAALGNENIGAHPDWVGIGLELFDAGTLSMLQVCELVIQVLGHPSNEAFVDMVYENVVGMAPTAEQRAFYVGLLQGGGGPYTQAQLLEIAANAPINAENIDLVGLQQTGVEFV